MLLAKLFTALTVCAVATNAFTLQTARQSTTTTHTAAPAPPLTSPRSFRSATALASVVAPPEIPTKVVNNGAEELTTWECDEDAMCVEVPACDDEECRTSLDVRIHNKWYDLSGWRKAHPAGAHWIDWYDGRDATEVMDAFHSAKGREMYQRLPASKPETAQMLESIAVPDSPTQIAFRKLRDDLEKEG